MCLWILREWCPNKKRLANTASLFGCWLFFLTTLYTPGRIGTIECVAMLASPGGVALAVEGLLRFRIFFWVALGSKAGVIKEFCPLKAM